MRDLRKVYDELDKIFGRIPTEKVYSHVFSLERSIENLTISRDSWKRKYMLLKQVHKKLKMGGKTKLYKKQ